MIDTVKVKIVSLLGLGTVHIVPLVSKALKMKTSRKIAISGWTPIGMSNVIPLTVLTLQRLTQSNGVLKGTGTVEIVSLIGVRLRRGVGNVCLMQAWSVLKRERQTTLPEHDWRLSEETGWTGVPPVVNWTAYSPDDRKKWLADDIDLPKDKQWSVANEPKGPESPVVQQFGRQRQKGGKVTVVGLRGKKAHGKDRRGVRVTPVEDLPPPKHRYVGEHEVIPKGE